MKKIATLAAFALLPTGALAEAEFFGDFDLKYSTNSNSNVGDWNHTRLLFDTGLKADRVELTFGGAMNRFDVDGFDATLNLGELRGLYSFNDNFAIEAGFGRFLIDGEDDVDFKNVRVHGSFGNFVAAAGTYWTTLDSEGSRNLNEFYLGYDYSENGRAYVVIADGDAFADIRVVGLKHYDENWGLDASVVRIEDLDLYFVKGHYNLNNSLLVLGELASFQVEGNQLDTVDLGLGYRFRPSTYAYATLGKLKGDGAEFNRISFGLRHMFGTKPKQTPSIFDYLYEPLFSQGFVGR